MQMWLCQLKVFNMSVDHNTACDVQNNTIPAE